MIQDRLARPRLIDGVISALMFTAAVATTGALERVGQTNALGLALVSTMIVAGAVVALRVPAPFTAQFTRLGDWIQHGADFAAAVFGLWVVASVFPASRDFLCEPLVPWRVSIAIFGAFGTNWLAAAAKPRAEFPPGPMIYLGFFWIAPFYGFFHAPWFLAQAVALPCEGRPFTQVVVAGIAMAVAAVGGHWTARRMIK